MGVGTAVHKRRIGIESELGMLDTAGEFAADRREQQRRILDTAFSDSRRIGPTAAWKVNVSKPSPESPLDLSLPSCGLGLDNGGRIYLDLQHIESCTSTARNALEAVALQRAGDRKLHKLYANFVRNDYDALSTSESEVNAREVGVPFGAHINFWTTARAFEQLPLLLPHLATMQIYAGAGVFSKPEFPFDEGSRYHKVAAFSLSARSLFMKKLFGINTIRDRAIVTMNREPHGALAAGTRMHILADSLMHDRPIFLQLFTTDVVLRAIEEGVLQPHAALFAFDGDSHFASMASGEDTPPPLIQDMREIRRRQGGWRMTSMKARGMKSPIAVQSKLLEITRAAFGSEPNPVNVLGFSLWETALARLSKLTGRLDRRGMSKDDLSPLFGLVDWATKKYLFDQLVNERCLKWQTPEFSTSEDLAYLVSLDLEYHVLDPERNISGAFGASKIVPELVPESTVRHFEHFAPPGRGLVHHLLARAAQRFKTRPGEILVDWAAMRVCGELTPLPDPNCCYPEIQKMLRRRFDL